MSANNLSLKQGNDERTITLDDPALTKTTTTEEDQQEDDIPQMGCGIFGRYPLISMLAFATIGICTGIGFSYWEDDGDTKDTLLKWIGLIGDLFIRALKCIVLPLVFVNVTMSVMDMMQIGKAGSIGWKTIGLYLMTTVAASILGIISIVSFKGLFTEGEFEEASPAAITLGCSEEGSFLAEMDDGTVVCTTDFGDEANTLFTITDVSGTFATTSSGPSDNISLSDTIYDGIFTKLVPSNITAAFAEGNFAAIVVFAIIFGVALSCAVVDKNKKQNKNQNTGTNDQTDPSSSSHVMSFFKELDAVFITMINWIIMLTPFAVFSLIVKAVGSQDNLSESFSNVGYLVVATILAMLAHYGIIHWGLFLIVTGSNPWTYLKKIIPAQTMAFACASSAATIPMTLKSVMSTGRVPDSIARFIIPLGATVNMDGGAIYFPCACVWLAVLNGIELNIAHYVMLVFIATIGSMGTAPVPSASLVLIITAYNTVFNTTGTPEGFEYILAIDWFMDRLRTTLNVTGDAVVTGMVSSLCPVDDESDSVAMASSETSEGSQQEVA